MATPTLVIRLTSRQQNAVLSVSDVWDAARRLYGADAAACFLLPMLRGLEQHVASTFNP